MWFNHMFNDGMIKPWAKVMKKPGRFRVVICRSHESARQFSQCTPRTVKEER